MKERTLVERFSINALACTLATTATHPIELVKTRMQLQGELTKTYQKTYTSTSKSAVLIVESDGLKALWSGLSAGLMYQVVMNGSRLTLFDNLTALGVPALPAGMVSGAVGGGVGSPFYLLKTQQQALSNLNVGSQHKDANVPMLQWFRREVKEGGVSRLWRGSPAQMARVTVGSGAQLSSFTKSKELLGPVFEGNWFLTTAVSSVVASVFVVFFMSPFDVVSTRIFNQPVDPVTKRGLYYKGTIHALGKIWKEEGSTAYLKGLRAGYPRHALQTVLTMTIWDALKNFYDSWQNSM
jgi:solute carrier family 25 protein 34/35